MSHLRSRHPKIHEVVRQKTDKNKCKQASQAKKKSVYTQQWTTLPGIAARKEKLDTNSTLHKITRGIAGMMIHDFQPYPFVEDRGFTKLMQQLGP